MAHNNFSIAKADHQNANMVDAACAALRNIILGELANGITHGRYGVSVVLRDGRITLIEQEIRRTSRG